MTAAVLSNDVAFFGPSVRQERANMGTLSADTIKDLPEAFAPDFCIRNTFIDSTSSRRPSLEDFLPRARCLSAPSTSVGVRMRIASTMDPVREEDAREWVDSHEEASSSTTCFPPASPYEHWGSMSNLGHVHTGGVTDQRFVFMPNGENQVNQLALGNPLIHFGAQVNTIHEHVLSQNPVGSWHQGVMQQTRLESTPIGEDSGALPSDLSSAHGAGLCKPCAWYHSAKGCKTGTSCKFCHLCAPGELKRRKREKNILLAAQNANTNV